MRIRPLLKRARCAATPWAFALGALLAAAVCAGGEDPGGVYPLPIAEVEAMLEQGLEGRGFAVSSHGLAMGMKALKARKADALLNFILAPRSALATQIQAAGSAGGRTGDAYLLEIMGPPPGMSTGDAPTGGRVPIRPSNRPDDPGGAANQVIPNPVLSHIASVVCITAVSQERTVQFSGFVVDQDGLILCTAHDLKNLQRMIVGFYDGVRMDGRILEMDSRRDLVLLQVPARLDGYIPLTGGRNLVGMGERLFTVGCPENLNGTVYSGFVNGPPRKVRGLPLWQVNMEILPGSSGSPVFDVGGNLIGMVKGRLRGTDRVGFLIPVETIIAFLKENLREKR